MPPYRAPSPDNMRDRRPNFLQISDNDYFGQRNYEHAIESHRDQYHPHNDRYYCNEPARDANNHLDKSYRFQQEPGIYATDYDYERENRADFSYGSAHCHTRPEPPSYPSSNFPPTSNPRLNLADDYYMSEEDELAYISRNASATVRE